MLEPLDGLFGVRLHHVGNHDVPRVLPVDGDVDDRADAVAADKRNAAQRHQLVVARQHGVAVHHGGNALAADLLNVAHAVAVDGLAVGALEALADGVRGGTFRQRRVFQQLFVLHLAVVNAADLENALRQRAGFVKDDRFDLRQRFQIVRALNQHALFARAADAREEAQRDADDQRAGAGDDQKRQRAVNPIAPLRRMPQHQPDDGRQNRQRQRAVTDGGRIHAGEFGDEVFGFGFVGAGILDQLEDFGDGGFAEGLRRLNPQHAGHVDAAADDLVACLCVAGQALAGQCARVQAGRAGEDHAVQRHFFARLHDDHAADLHLVRIDLFKLAVALNVRVIRADIHQRADVAAALADGVALKQLADLIKQHDGDGFHIVAAARDDRQRERADGGHGHQKVFVEHLTVQNAPPRLFQNVIADDQIGDQIQRKLQNAGHGDQLQRDQHGRSGQDAREHLFLLPVHDLLSFDSAPVWGCGRISPARSRNPAPPCGRP